MNPIHTVTAAGVTVAFAGLVAATATAQEPKPWPAPVKGWAPLEPGEHPRLVFRKADLPALRKRAERPEGKVIVERTKKQVEAPFSTWHAAGAAFLYQVTGDKAWADKAFQFAEMTLMGQKNPDDRYTWPGNGQLRAGPCLSGMGLAYDMAYDGWTDEQRKKVAAGIMANSYFDEIPTKPRHCPGCNHWGAHQGGCGIAVIALKDDPGVPKEKIDQYLEAIVGNIKRAILEGHGKFGYYYEGHHCGRLADNTGMNMFIQAYRTACGQDLVTGCSNAEWLLTKWVYEFVDHGTNYTYNSRGMYRGEFGRVGMSSGGDFAHGFGICPDAHKPAVLWLYDRIIEPGEKTYDIVSHPHRAPYALANWPFDVPERNPGEMFPQSRYEEGPGYCVFRNGWQDKGNIVVTALLGSTPGGGRGMACGGSVEVCGMGMKYVFPGIFFLTRLTHSQFAEDGSGVISAVLLDNAADGKAKAIIDLGKAPTSLAVDFSKASGADLLVAQVGTQVGFQTGYWLDIQKAVIKDMKDDTGYFTKTTCLQAGAGGDMDALEEDLLGGAAASGQKSKGLTWYVMTLQKGAAPSVAMDGGKVKVGGQTLSFDGKKITLGKIAGPWKGPPP
jgi:hypothetical protein